MELVYLWVENYKNIKKQGFNFSPRFRCDYDEEKNELEIIDKDETGEFYPKNFFGDNINVTAIIGENGSGKSAIIHNFVTKQRGFFIVKENNALIIYYKKISILTILEKKELKNDFYINTLFYSMDNNNYTKTNRYLNHIDFNKTNELIVKHFQELQNTEFSLSNFKPFNIRFKLIDYWIPDDYDNNDKDIEDIKLVLNRDTQNDTEIIKNTINALKNINDLYLIYLFNRFGTVSSIFEYIDLTKKINPVKGNINITYDEIQKILNQNKFYFIDEETFNKVKNNSNIPIEVNKLNDILGKDYLEILFIDMIDELEFHFESKNSSTFSSLSHGEKTLYIFYLNLINFAQETILLVLDEPDNTLHPNWQKKFIDELIKICVKLNIKAHFIISSHSPFILSDMPKENIIFLEKGKQVYPFDDGKQTFGANIHTLLSHGFFMKDGLMGEFAKSKIDDVIKYLNNDIKTTITTDKDAQNIIDIIGEPIIKRELQRMLKNKMELSNKTEIDTIKDKIKLLTERLEKLEPKD